LYITFDSFALLFRLAFFVAFARNLHHIKFLQIVVALDDGYAEYTLLDFRNEFAELGSELHTLKTSHRMKI